MATQDQSGEQPIITGTHGGYYWLTDSDQYIGTLVRICADAVLGRYLAVTSIDSGSAWLTDRQQASKWQLRSGIAYSPRLADVEDLFYQRDGAESPGTGWVTGTELMRPEVLIDPWEALNLASKF